jgi:internalin A
MIDWQRLWEFVKSAIRMLRGRKRDQAAFFVAALCFSAGFALTKLVPDLIAGKWIARLQVALYALGAIAFVYGVVRVWRLVNPPELPAAKDRPSAIKGPMAFTEADGELFRKLGRESELRKLFGLVQDDQVLMIVVRGASGAGKTSLLRAGLKHILGDNAVLHYWEAVPAEPDKGLLRAIQEKWPEGVTKPITLAELINPSDALGRQSHVIVLDQFEQLRGNQKIFELLRRIIRKSKPPHRITWVIAFRREFSADWMDFISPEQENGIRPPQDVSLRLFTAEQSREVIAQLINESDLKDSIEQSVINNLVEAATFDGEVSPVDIGIGLLVLTELHERQSGQTITNRDYQFAGGAEGLLTQYISRCLEPFPKESQEAILKAMLALRDPDEPRQRLATGLTIDELATEAGTDARVLKSQLNRLADRDIRLLEADTPTDGSAMRYRLPHERLIPALYRLTGKLLAEVDQAKLKFQNAFQAWQTNDKRSRYLLKGKELRLVQRYEALIPWGQDEQEKKSFLFRSKRRRHFIRAATVAVVFASIGAGWLSILQYQRFENRRDLTDNGYPAELYDFQHQLKKLEMTEPLNLERFNWLSSDSIEELSVKAVDSSNSIAGLSSLSKCRSLKKLALDLTDSQVNNLKSLEELKSLTQLTLDLGPSQVKDLKPLEQLKALTELTLDLNESQVRDLTPLEQLPGLTHLTLDLNQSEVRDLKPLEQLTGLTQLTLNLIGTKVSDLQPLAHLKGLRQLSLYVIGAQVRELKFLEQLIGLTQLTLFSGDGMDDLKPLEQLKGLTQLSLNVALNDEGLQHLQQLPGLTQLSLPIKQENLQNLQQLPGLTQLTLYFDTSHVSDLKSLEHLKGLTHLSLELGFSEISDLQPLKQLQALTQLSLDLSGSGVSDLKPLEQLKRLTQLSLDVGISDIMDLQSLEQLKELTQLTLDLRISKVGDLKPLEQLQRLTELSLDLRNGNVSDLKPLEQLKGPQLNLFLSDKQLRELQSLEKLKGLTQLSIDLEDSQVNDLEPMRNLTGLQALSIENATRAQRMSLRNIPTSLVELKF